MPAPKGQRVRSKCHTDRLAYAHGLCSACWQREYRLRDIEVSRKKKRDRQHRADLKKNYGLTVGQYGVLLERQSGVCAICGRPPYSTRFTRLGVDHDHSTGRVRGLLCSRCNTGLGLFDDKPELLHLAAAYLDRVATA